MDEGERPSGGVGGEGCLSGGVRRGGDGRESLGEVAVVVCLPVRRRR